MTPQRKPLLTGFEARSVALIASWTLAGAALAQTTPRATDETAGQRTGALLAQADRHGDGRISREAAQAVPGLPALFERLDSGRHGTVGPDAFAQGVQN